MIKINGGAKFLQTTVDTMTSKKVENLEVNFQTSLVDEVIPAEEEGAESTSIKVGKVGSWIFNEEGTNIMGVQKIQNLSDFDGKDILNTLTDAYIVQLKALNPSVSFTNTLKP